MDGRMNWDLFTQMPQIVLAIQLIVIKGIAANALEFRFKASHSQDVEKVKALKPAYSDQFAAKTTLRYAQI